VVVAVRIFAGAELDAFLPVGNDTLAFPEAAFMVENPAPSGAVLDRPVGIGEYQRVLVLAVFKEIEDAFFIPSGGRQS
jgi:hypothetical protein